VIIPFSIALRFIDVECWDWDMIGSDDFMGEFSIDLSELDVGKPVEQDFKLEEAETKSKKKKTSNVKGTLKLRVEKLPE